jgi:hypothetical protein
VGTTISEEIKSSLSSTLGIPDVASVESTIEATIGQSITNETVIKVGGDLKDGALGDCECMKLELWVTEVKIEAVFYDDDWIFDDTQTIKVAEFATGDWKYTAIKKSCIKGVCPIGPNAKTDPTSQSQVIK